MYREVCSTCHSIKFVAFRNLIGVSHTEAEVRSKGAGCLVLSCLAVVMHGFYVHVCSFALACLLACVWRALVFGRVKNGMALVILAVFVLVVSLGFFVGGIERRPPPSSCHVRGLVSCLIVQYVSKRRP